MTTFFRKKAIILLIFTTICGSFASSPPEQHESAIIVEEETVSTGCECIDYDCGCCSYIYFYEGQICSNFTYLPDEYGIALTLTYININSSYTLFNETISARNPPPFCLGIPEIEKFGAEVCFEFYDLDIKDKRFSGCLKIRAFIYHIIHKTIDAGCFSIPPKVSFDNDELRRLVKVNFPSVKLVN